MLLVCGFYWCWVLSGLRLGLLSWLFCSGCLNSGVVVESNWVSLAALYEGALLLLITGLKGLPALWNFSWAFCVGGIVFLWVRCLTCSLLKLPMMEILMSETCWTHEKRNKKASDSKLVFHSSTITMMHGPINISFVEGLLTTAF